jgi:ATPase subunit of ABC transporter with duplicated ATPase domains
LIVSFFIEPIQLVEAQDHRILQEATFNIDALRQLLGTLPSEVKHVRAIAIVGRQGEGKSTLLNYFCRQEIFRMGHYARHESSGLACVLISHPFDPSIAILLVDTQGAGQLDQVDQRVLLWAVLACDAVLYNFQGNVTARSNDFNVMHHMVSVCVCECACEYM